MTRRRATALMHWANLVLLFLLLASRNENGALAILFAVNALAMVALALVKGLANGPGPRLDGVLRKAHPWMARAMYVLLGWGAVAVLVAQTGSALPGPGVREVLLTLFGVGLLHGVFHLWRASALNDGALRRMMP